MGKVLIAEDEKTQQAILMKAVESTGHFGLVASNGQIAWELLNANPGIDLLITDVVMPELGGKELIQMIRDSKKYRDLPVIIISGKVGIKEIDSLLQLGASRFMPKPVRMEELEEYIERLLRVHSVLK